MSRGCSDEEESRAYRDYDNRRIYSDIFGSDDRQRTPDEQAYYDDYRTRKIEKLRDTIKRKGGYDYK